VPETLSPKVPETLALASARNPSPKP